MRNSLLTIQIVTNDTFVILIICVVSKIKNNFLAKDGLNLNNKNSFIIMAKTFI